MDLYFQSDRDQLRASLASGEISADALGALLGESLAATDRMSEILAYATEQGERRRHALVQADVTIAGLRARVQVRDSDFSEYGVTAAHVDAWLAWAGWHAIDNDDDRNVRYMRNGETAFLFHRGEDHRSPGAINWLAKKHGRPALDILDEMAGML